MSQLEVDKIVPQSGTTLTIGDSGDTVNFADGTALSIDTNTLYIDSTNNRVGILTTSPAKTLQIVKSDDYALRVGASDYHWDLGSISGSSPKLNAVGNGTSAIFEINGSEKIRLDNSGNFLINTSSAKGDDASTFAPVLTVNGGSYDGIIEVAGNRSDANGAGVARLQFIQNLNSATYKEVAEIRVETEGTTANQRGGRINFRTRADGSTSTTEQMRIDSSGNVMVGTTDSTPASSSSGSGISLRENGSIEASRDGSSPLFLNRQTSDGKIIDLYKDGTTIGNIGNSGNNLVIDGTYNTAKPGLEFQGNAIVPRQNSALSDNAIALGTSSNRFTNLYLGGGLYVGGTSDSNKLQDYETGLHTVTMTDTGGGATITMNTSFDQLSYTKIGRLVYITGVLLPSSVTGTFSGTTRITLPFTASNETDQAGKTFMNIATYVVDWTAGTSPYLSIGEGNNFGELGVSQDNGSGGQARVSGSSQVYISGSYITNA